MMVIVNWGNIAKTLEDWACRGDRLWRGGQELSLRWMARRLLEQNGVLIADEVGLGKTRLAVAVALAVHQAGGHIAVVVPPGLMYQWEEEFRKFSLALNPNQKPLSLTHLRTYFDLFKKENETEDGGVIWPIPSPVLISHRFGIPQRLHDRSNPQRWALPVYVRKLLCERREGDSFDGRSFRGFGNIDLENNQVAAVEWLMGARILHNSLKSQIVKCEELRPSEGATVFLENDKANNLFHALIGTLIGPPDLVIIDEAHKNRSGAIGGAEQTLQSRLSSCLNKILFPTSQLDGKILKRIALTATPLELGADQWGDLLARIGVEKNQRENMVQVAQDFAAAVTNPGWMTMTGLGIKELKNASNEYKKAFQSWLTRRRWQDHHIMKDFVQQLSQEGSDMAHPHRTWIPHKVDLSELASNGHKSDIDRLWMLAVAGDAIAALSKGEDVPLTVKTLGARESQGIATNLFDESLGGLSAAGKNASAKQQRMVFWRNVYCNALIPDNSLKADPKYYLQWHPRVLAAIYQIEKMTVKGDKILVFGAFNAPLEALTRALNIRQYLQDVQKGKPTLLPSGIHENDPDVRHWLKRDEVNIRGFKIKAKECYQNYEKVRDKRRRWCESAVGKFLDDEYGKEVSDNQEVSDNRKKGLVDWLLLHFDPLKNMTNFQEQALAMLRTLLDQDKPVDTNRSSENDQENFDEEIENDLKSLMNRVHDDLPMDKHIRRSPFSRFMSGEVKTQTRRTMQFQFNQKAMRPQVLVAQSAVASEGLNLHKACKKVFLFHLDWNPARIEQQIGRVDREDSLWMEQAKIWIKEGAKAGKCPKIEIHTLAIAGTYDEHKQHVITERQRILKSQLFGELLEPEVLDKLDPELREAVASIAPNFSPQKPDNFKKDCS